MRQDASAVRVTAAGSVPGGNERAARVPFCSNWFIPARRGEGVRSAPGARRERGAYFLREVVDTRSG